MYSSAGFFLELCPFVRREKRLLHLVVQFRSLGRVLEHVVGVGVGDESLPGDGYLGHVDGYPPSAPSLGLERHGSGAAGKVQNQVPRVGCHQEAAFEDLRWCFYDVLFIPGSSQVCPDRVHVPAGQFIFVAFPSERVRRCLRKAALEANGYPWGTGSHWPRRQDRIAVR